MNAIAHCVEALYAEDANPIMSLMAEEGIRTLAASLPTVVSKPDDLEARSDALYGAWLAGACLGKVGMALHHKLCHTLGGTFNLPHAETHTVVLPHATRYNARRRRKPWCVSNGRWARRTRRLASTIWRTHRRTERVEADRHAGGRARPGRRSRRHQSYWNPRPLERDAIRELLQDGMGGPPSG